MTFRRTAVGKAGGGGFGGEYVGVNTTKDKAKPTMDSRGPSRRLKSKP